MVCHICHSTPHVAISGSPLCRSCAHRVIDAAADREQSVIQARAELRAHPPQLSIAALAAAA
jgi:hypothetical protein